MNIKSWAIASAIIVSSFISAKSEAGILNLGDDVSVEQSLGFDFEFFGETYSSVFVGSNGYLTFGGGDSDFTETAGDLLNTVGRIGIWDDFHPGNGGSIETTTTADSFTVSFLNVPQWGGSDENSFALTLFANGSFEIFIDSLATNDFLISVVGENSTSAQSVDFSSKSAWDVQDTPIYQLISSGAGALNGTRLTFNGTATVSEPATMAMLSLGLLAFGLRRKV